jgi:hypothetical protein
MKQFLAIFMLLALLSCKKNDNSRHLYFQVNTYRNDLIETINNQDIFIRQECDNNTFFLERYKEQHKTALSIKNTCKDFGFKNRRRLIIKRDSINEKLSFHLKFAPTTSYDNVDDSIFEKIIDVDFLRLTQRYQNARMFPPKEM